MKTGIELIRDINSKWYNELKKDTTLEIMMYEPFSDDYWKEKYKIVLCNLEPGGKMQNKDLLDISCFQHWLEEKNPTIKKSAQFIHYLYGKLHGIDIDFKQLNNVDNNLLINTMKKVTYMNLLRDAGNSKFDKKYFWDFFNDEKYKTDNRIKTIDFINALSPDIFIISSEDGAILIEQLFCGSFKDIHFFRNNNTLFVSISHPSRLNDSQFIERIDIILNNL